MNTPNRPLNRRLSFWIVILIIVLLIFFIRHIRSNANRVIPQATPSVVVGEATLKDVPVYLSAIGTVTSINSVTVRTQINGQLIRVLFTEGQMVKKGDLLAEIDPRPYEAQLKQYQGQLERDTALLANSQLDLQRYQTLWKQDSVAKQTLDTEAATVQQNEGIVKIDQGLIESTQVNLTYCRITSPIDGRVGLRLVDPGNYVQVSDATGIAVITMTHPINVVFTIPEDDVQVVLEKLNAKIPLTTLAFDRMQKKLLGTGQLLTMDNQIDTTTGTVKLKSVFKNDNNLLFPNQFVNIKLLIDTLKKATVIPTAAVQQGINAPFVYILRTDGTVKMQNIQKGPTEDNDTVVKSGVSPGEKVVVEGADKLTDGATVTVGSQ